MGIIRYTKDALTSLVNNLGIVGKDKAASTYYSLPLWSDADLLTMYRSAWLPKKIINIPAFDSVSKWRNWQADEAEIGLIEAEEKRLGLRQKYLDVQIMARLFGGAALYISTGEKNVELPFEPERVGKGGLRFIQVMPKRMLNAGAIIEDPESEWFGEPEFYTLANNPAVRIHPSRLVVFKGEKVPDNDIMRTADVLGWGDSVLLSTLDAIKQVDNTAANIVSLIFEAKTDVINIPNLMDSLSDPESERRLLQRFQLAATAKGNNGTLILDAEETYTQKSASFATLPDILTSMTVLASGAADIPATRLLGQSPAGMNATGESDLRNYYDRLKSMQTLIIDTASERLTQALIRSALGKSDPSIHHIWASLWQITDKERAEIGKMTADTISVLYNTSLYPPEALANAGMNMMIENSIMPGFDTEVVEAGGLPDYEAELEAEREAQLSLKTAQSKGAQAITDAAPKTLYIRRDVANVADIRAWAKAQGFDTVQDGLHVTIIHTRTPLDWIKVGNATEWGEDEKGVLVIPAGGPRLMEQFGDAVVLQFASSRLTWRHEDIKRMGAEVDFPEYQPHITITWRKPDNMRLNEIEPFKGEIVLGHEIFEEVKDDWKSGIVEV